VHDAAHGDGRDGVFEDQLFLVVGFEDNRIFVKGTDAPRRLTPLTK